MENRIRINGVWYVKEYAETDLDIYKSYIKYYEDDKVFLEAVFNDPNFKELDFITYKNKSPETKEVWDNDLWFDKVIRNDKDAILEIPYNTDICVQFIKQIY